MKRCLAVLVGWAVMMACAHGQSERSLIREGNRLYNSSKYADAEVNYRKALDKNKEIHEGAFNLGDALYKQGRYGEAAEQYQVAASRLKDDKGKARVLHNLGNSLLKAQKVPESIAAYKEALRQNPNDADTKYNLQYAKMMLKQQQQRQKQDQKKDDKQKQDQKDEQKKEEQERKDQQQQDQKKEEERKQQQAEQKDQQQKQAQQKKQQISKQDAERIL